MDAIIPRTTRDRMNIATALCAAVVAVAASHGAERRGIQPGTPWPDTDGTHINAHGYGILEHEGTYHWYGSRKIPGKTEADKNEAGVGCYTSTDLRNWRNRGLVLSVTARDQDPEISEAGILDRPKVFFNTTTAMFVMHFKLYPPKAAGGTKGTDVAYVGTATSQSPLGPFRYQGRYTGGGSPNGTGDFAIYQDEDGTFWHIAVRKPDKTLVCGKLSPDGLRPLGGYKVMDGVTRATEAPVAFRRGNGKVYLFASGSTGWNPNPTRMFVADRLEGPYEPLGNPCQGTNPHNQFGPERSFGGQSTFILPMPGRKDEWIAMFDIWNPTHPVQAGYIWLPLVFKNDQPVIRWQNEWSLTSDPSPNTP